MRTSVEKCTNKDLVLEENINILNNKLFSKTWVLSEYIELKSEGNYRANGIWEDEPSRESFKYDIHETDRLRITSWTGGIVPECVFFDKNGTFISAINNDDPWSNKEHEYEVPQNAYYLYTATTDIGLHYPIVYIYTFDNSYNIQKEVESVNENMVSLNNRVNEVNELINQLQDNIENISGIDELKSDLFNLKDNKKSIKVEQTINNKVNANSTYIKLDKTIPANTEVFWEAYTDVETSTGISLAFNTGNNEASRQHISKNSNGSFIFADSLSYFQIWCSVDLEVYITVRFYYYTTEQAFASIDDINNLENGIDSLSTEINASIIAVNDKVKIIDALNNSVFGGKRNVALVPYIENPDNKIYNKNGKLIDYNGAFSNLYNINEIENISIFNFAGGVIPLYCFFDANEKFIEGSSYTHNKGWTGEYLSVNIPENAYYVGVNGSDSRNNIRINGLSFETTYKIREEVERIESSIPNIPDLQYDILNIQSQLSKVQRMNDFAYSEFDKAYFVLTIDDANMYLPIIYDLCHELGIPLCPAIIPSKLNTLYDGRTVRDICNLVIADGGEILSHSGKYINPDSTEQDYIDVFKETKKTLENEGYTIRGIITAGGAGYSSYTKKLDDWSRKYYDYSDQNGLKTSIAYSHSRWWHHDYTMEQAKQYVDNAILNKSFVVMAMHGSNDTNDLEHVDHVRELLEYMIAKGSDKLEFTTWQYVYDTFKSTVIEEKIKALTKTL